MQVFILRSTDETSNPAVLGAGLLACLRATHHRRLPKGHARSPASRRYQTTPPSLLFFWRPPLPANARNALSKPFAIYKKGHNGSRHLLLPKAEGARGAQLLGHAGGEVLLGTGAAAGAVAAEVVCAYGRLRVQVDVQVGAGRIAAHPLRGTSPHSSF